MCLTGLRCLPGVPTVRSRGLGTSHTSLPDSESDEDRPDAGPEPPAPVDQEPAENEADVSYGDEPLPVLGQAKALYAFDGKRWVVGGFVWGGRELGEGG